MKSLHAISFHLTLFTSSVKSISVRNNRINSWNAFSLLAKQAYGVPWQFQVWSTSKERLLLTLYWLLLTLYWLLLTLYWLLLTLYWLLLTLYWLLLTLFGLLAFPKVTSFYFNLPQFTLINTNFKLRYFLISAFHWFTSICPSVSTKGFNHHLFLSTFTFPHMLPIIHPTQNPPFTNGMGN